MVKKLKLKRQILMLFVFSLIFDGCSLPKLEKPNKISLPIIGTYYGKQKVKVVVKKKFIHVKQRKLYPLPKVNNYKIKGIKSISKNRFSIPKIELYKAQQNCKLKTKRLKQYEQLIRRK